MFRFYETVSVPKEVLEKVLGSPQIQFRGPEAVLMKEKVSHKSRLSEVENGVQLFRGVCAPGRAVGPVKPIR